MSDCGCKPGTHDEGWHERRSESCDRAEREAFADVVRRAPELIRRVLRRQR